MIYITGDRHGDYRSLIDFCIETNTKIDDVIIILGDAGINYHLDYRDTLLKEKLKELSITLFCVHGNHEERPQNIASYKTKIFHDGIVYYEEKYPNILFAKDGEIYNFKNLKTMPIGGAYSIDKAYRVLNGYPWYKDEQPSDEIKEHIRKVLENNGNKIDVILSHTCPYKYMPFEAFLDGVDEVEVDKTTELFLDEIEDTTDYQRWYCGHFHIDKDIDKMEFMMYRIDPFMKKEKRLIKTK